MDEKDEVFADFRKRNHGAQHVKDHGAIFAPIVGEDDLALGGVAVHSRDFRRIFLNAEKFVEDALTCNLNILKCLLTSGRSRSC